MKLCSEINKLMFVKAIIWRSLLSILLLIPNLLYAQALVLKTGTTDIQQADVEITNVSDPAGHSCCVIAPPSLIEIFILEGDLVIRQEPGSETVSWMPFDSLTVDENLEFIGQSQSTVAGFNNIITVINGTIQRDSITGQISIGTGGGLPSGAPITYDFTFTPVLGSEFFITDIGIPTLALHATVGLGVQILDVPVESEDEIPPGIALSLNAAGQGGTDADWWLVMLIGGDLFSFNINTGLFEAGLRPTYQGPIIDVPEPIRFWDFDGSPPADFTIFFGLDFIVDSLVNEDTLIGTGFHYFFH